MSALYTIGVEYIWEVATSSAYIAMAISLLLAELVENNINEASECLFYISK